MIPSSPSVLEPPVPDAALPALPASACPVCGCELRGALQACGSCHTPLHADCASFVGRCAAFGCGGTEFIDAGTVDAGPAQATLEIVESPDLPVPATPRFRRGVAGRTWAGAGILASRPGVTLPLLTLLILSNALAFIPFFTQLIGLLGQGLLVILLTAQARGKESGFGEALSLLAERGTRVLATGIAYSIMWCVPAVLGTGLLVTAVTSGSALLGLAGLGFTALALRNAVSFALTTIIAASEEEPGKVFEKSAQLVEPGRTQAFAGVMGFTLASEGFAWLVLMTLVTYPTPAGIWGAVLMVMVMKPVIMLLSTSYWLLYYLEARRIRQTDYLPFAPHGYLPSRGATEEEIG